MAPKGNSSTSVPETMKAWTIEGKSGFDNLIFNPKAPVPEPSDYEVLVKFHAASLNYRDLIIPKGKYPWPSTASINPLSDGSGTIVKVGPKVTRFQAGDKVCTLFNQTHLSPTLTPYNLASGLGGSVNGTLRQYGTFNENGLVPMPSNLSFNQAATLTCAGVTAWNALYGVASQQVKPGDWVLTQGTGGVSIFALQFAKAAGGRVIATTSSAAKADVLKKLGADYVFNYKETKNWGEEAKKISGNGVDFVIEVGGPTTFGQSLTAVKIGGIIAVVGFVGGTTQGPGFMEILENLCTVRGILVGSRDLFEDMNRAIESSDIKPVVDEKIFSIDSAKEAYEYMWAQKHFGKVVISIE